MNTVSDWGLSYPLVTFERLTPIPMRTACTDLITPTPQWVAGLRRAEIGELEAFLRHYVPHYGYEDSRVQTVIEELTDRGYYYKPHVLPMLDRLYQGVEVRVRNPLYGFGFVIRRLSWGASKNGGWYAIYDLRGRKINGGVYRTRLEVCQWLNDLEPLE